VKRREGAVTEKYGGSVIPETIAGLHESVVGAPSERVLADCNGGLKTRAVAPPNTSSVSDGHVGCFNGVVDVPKSCLAKARVVPDGLRPLTLSPSWPPLIDGAAVNDRSSAGCTGRETNSKYVDGGGPMPEIGRDSQP